MSYRGHSLGKFYAKITLVLFEKNSMAAGKYVFSVKYCGACPVRVSVFHRGQLLALF